jgi:hypothetical protein
MPDRFARFSDSLGNPARRAIAVTPSDSTDFLNTGDVPKSLYIGGAGTLVVQMVDDTATVTFSGLLAGTTLDVRPRRVLATGTTATNIIALG